MTDNELSTTEMEQINQQIDALPSLRALVDELDMKARKSLGQNFLFDMNLTRRIARSAQPLTGTTIEIGPGPGGLTRAILLEGANDLITIEKDWRASAVLQSLMMAAGNRMTLVEDDALKCAIWQMGTTPRRVIANLPYNIATTLLIKWLEHASDFTSLTLMFQREVALRITARPGDSEYGRLSILANWKAETEILFDVPASAFVPQPKIISSVIKVIPLAKPRFDCNQSYLENVTRHAFRQRRKMLRNSLEHIGGQELLAEAGVNPKARPQDLEIAEFCALARCLEARQLRKRP